MGEATSRRPVVRLQEDGTNSSDLMDTPLDREGVQKDMLLVNNLRVKI